MPTTAASVGTVARIANSAVPAASAGISPSTAECAARSQRAGAASLVCHQASQRSRSCLRLRIVVPIMPGSARVRLVLVLAVVACHRDAPPPPPASGAPEDLVAYLTTVAGSDDT